MLSAFCKGKIPAISREIAGILPLQCLKLTNPLSPSLNSCRTSQCHVSGGKRLLAQFVIHRLNHKLGCVIGLT